MPTTTDSIPAKDSTGTNLTAYNFSSLARTDTVPTSTDTIPAKDSTGTNLTAYNFLNFASFAGQDTVPTTTDTIPKKDSTANLSSGVKLNPGSLATIFQNSGIAGFVKGEVAAILPAEKDNIS